MCKLGGEDPEVLMSDSMVTRATALLARWAEAVEP